MPGRNSILASAESVFAFSPITPSARTHLARHSSFSLFIMSLSPFFSLFTSPPVLFLFSRCTVISLLDKTRRLTLYLHTFSPEFFRVPFQYERLHQSCISRFLGPATLYISTCSHLTVGYFFLFPWSIFSISFLVPFVSIGYEIIETPHPGLADFVTRLPTTAQKGETTLFGQLRDTIPTTVSIFNGILRLGVSNYVRGPTGCKDGRFYCNHSQSPAILYSIGWLIIASVPSVFDLRQRSYYRAMFR